MKLTYKQLAFILDIEAIEALEKIIAAHCKENGLPVPEAQDKVKDYSDKYPRELDVETLSNHLNLPTLQDAVKDIQTNFLIRPASKKWILCDYPEKKLKTLPAKKVKLPAALASLLPDDQIQTIKKEWEKRFNIPV